MPYGFRYDGKKYSEHSGKRGAASRAAAIGLTGEEIQDVGNWTSLKTAQKYIDQSTPLRFLKNKRLQLEPKRFQMTE